MRTLLMLAATAALFPATGCDSSVTVPNTADTAPYITPEERNRMPIEERDDPYVRQRTIQRP